MTLCVKCMGHAHIGLRVERAKIAIKNVRLVRKLVEVNT